MTIVLMTKYFQYLVAFQVNCLLWYFSESICMNFHNFILWPSLYRPENGISADKLRPGQPRYSWKTKTELCCTSSQPYSRLDSVWIWLCGQRAIKTIYSSICYNICSWKPQTTNMHHRSKPKRTKPNQTKPKRQPQTERPFPASFSH